VSVRRWQVSEVVWEREQRLRQALGCMGMRELAHWVTWHVYQVIMIYAHIGYI
jgi:hypothetical protein